MRLFFALFVALFILSAVAAFSPKNVGFFSRPSRRVALSAGEKTTETPVGFTKTESKNRDTRPFSDDLMDDMKVCLDTLEKRTQGGPGSLTQSEVQVFVAACSRIIQDMRQSAAALPERLAPGKRRIVAQEAAARVAEIADRAGATPKEVEAQAQTAYERVLSGTVSAETVIQEMSGFSASDRGETAASGSETEAESQNPVAVPPPPSEPEPANELAPEPEVLRNKSPVDENENDEPAYDGQGISMAKETANTYIIEGMDEMTAEEYQKALQQTIIERQRKRRLTTRVGSQSAEDYMKFLSGTAKPDRKGYIKTPTDRKA